MDHNHPRLVHTRRVPDEVRRGGEERTLGINNKDNIILRGGPRMGVA